MRMYARLIALTTACFTVCATAAPFIGPSTVTVDDPDGIFATFGLPLVATDTPDGFTLTGFTGITPPMVAARSFSTTITAQRSFRLSANPALVTLNPAGGFKLINAGGSVDLALPVTQVAVTARVFEADRGVNIPNLGFGQSYELLGNASETFTFGPDSDLQTFVLGPGVDYVLELAYEVGIELPAITNVNTVPQVVVVSEFGSTSDVQPGFSATLDVVLLPEPGTAALLALTSASLLTRRRARFRELT